MSRRALGLLVAAVVVLSSLVTWYASAQVRSPAEVAARTAPPAPSPILVPVERKVLATEIVSRGTGHYGSARPLSVAPSALKGSDRVVTSLPAAGAVLREGRVLCTLSGRPTFLLQGAQPSYRDLGPGTSGQDVRQLERALRRLGLQPGAVDGRYDEATARAVAGLYRRHGYDPVVATDAQLARVRPVEAALVEGGTATAGVQLPADEVVFAGSTPVRVSKLTASVGTPLQGALLTATNSVVTVDGSVPVAQAERLETGQRVLLDEPALGIEAAGTVRRVAAQPGTNGADGFHVAFEVVVPDPPRALVGASVRLTVPVRSTKEATLAVPVTAMTLGPDGGSRVQRVDGGRFTYVTVEPGLSADGFVAVTPTHGTLAAGDRVVVGFEHRGSSRG